MNIDSRYFGPLVNTSHKRGIVDNVKVTSYRYNVACLIINGDL